MLESTVKKMDINDYLTKKGGMNKRAKINPVEWAVFAVVLLVAHALGYFFQEPAQVFNGLGWDGRVYHQMAQQALAGQDFAQRSPFVYRQLLPTLAALLADRPEDLRDIFLLINLFFGTAAAVFILLLLRDFVADWRLRVVVASLYPLHYLGHIRYSQFQPIQTDAIMVMSVAAAFFLTQRIRAAPQAPQWIVLLTALCFIAVWNRGTALVIGLLAPLCAAFPDHEIGLRAQLFGMLRRLRPVWFAPLAAGALAYWWTHSNAQVIGVYGEEAASGENHSFLLYYLKYLYQEPLAHYLQGVFIAYGPSLAVVLWQWRAVVTVLKKHWHWLVFIGIIVAQGIIDTDRIMIHAFPLYAVLLGIALQQGREELKKKKILVVVLLLAQAVSQRLFWPLPVEMPADPSLTPSDTPVVLPLLFTPFTSDFLYYDLIAAHNRGEFGVLVVIQYMLFIIVTLFFLNFSGGGDSSASVPSKKRANIKRQKHTAKHTHAK